MGKPLIPIPVATASSRARVTGRPRLLEPSPDTSMTRRLARNGLIGNSVAAWSMAPLIEVPPPNSWRGVRSIAAANAAAVSSSPTRVHPHHLNLQRRPGPLHHGHADRPVRSGANGLQHARVAKCSDIAALLQL